MRVACVHLGSSNVYSEEKYNKLTEIAAEYADLVFRTAAVPNRDSLPAGLLSERARFDCIVLFVGSFFEGETIAVLRNHFRNLPLYIQGIREPETEGGNTVELNSWTGFNMAASFFKRYRMKFSWGYGDIEDKKIAAKLTDFLKAVKFKLQLSEVRVGVFGARVPGFYLSEANQLALQENSGVIVEYYSLMLLTDYAASVTEEELQTEYVRLEKEKKLRICVERAGLEKSIRIYLACKKIIAENGLSAVSLRCWPEFENICGITVCAVLSLLNDDGITASCECDIMGVVTMHIQRLLTGCTPFFADIVDIRENVLKAWHCGHGAPCLAKGEVCLCPHPSYAQAYPAAVQYEMKTGEITMCKLSELDGEFRLLCEEGISVEPVKSVKGIQTDISLDIDHAQFVKTVIENGFEHHYSIVHRRVGRLMEECCKWMDWKFTG